MSKIQIPQAEKNVFEELFTLIESHRLDPENNFPLGNLYDIVSSFDRAFQDFNYNAISGHNIKVYNELLNSTIGNFLIIFQNKGFRDEPIFYAFKRFISFFIKVLKEAALQKNLRDIKRTFYDNFPSLRSDLTQFSNAAEDLYSDNYIDELMEQKTAIEKFEFAFPVEIEVYNKNFDNSIILYAFSKRSNAFQESKEFLIYGDGFTKKFVKLNIESEEYEVVRTEYYMDINIHVNHNSESVEKLLKPIWLIVSALEAIDNIRVNIEEIKKGSIEISLRIEMKDDIAKEEVCAILEGAKQEVVSNLEVKKLTSSELYDPVVFPIESKIEEISSAITDVDIERKKLENERLKIENAKLKIGLLKELSDLVAQGLLEPDSIRVDINDILYLIKSGNNVNPGPDIANIA